MHMDFNSHVHGEITLFGFLPLQLTTTLISTWIAMGVLIVLGVVVRIKIKKFTPVPSTRFQNVIELMVEMMENFVKTTMGEENKGFSSWFFCIIAFIWVMNMEGLFGVRPATADLRTTAAFALTTFFLIHMMWIRSKRLSGYVKEYFEPFFLMLPMNLVGEIATPVSLAIRLFGNILSGTILMGLVYGMVPIFLKFGVPAVLNGYFDVFAGSLQAFIFVILSMSFIKNKSAAE